MLPRHFPLTVTVYTQAPVVQTMDSAVHRLNHYPADKHYQNQLIYPVDGDLSSGWRYPAFEQLEPGV